MLLALGVLMALLLPWVLLALSIRPQHRGPDVYLLMVNIGPWWWETILSTFWQMLLENVSCVYGMEGLTGILRRPISTKLMTGTVVINSSLVQHI